MGASSVFYETNDFEVSKRVRRQEDQKYKAIRQEVQERYISVEELSRDVLDT
jgi:tryptophan halogenase